MSMNITIFGAGYVGLVTGACLADAGHHVLCVDLDAVRVQQLRQGVVPIHEPGLDVIIRRTIDAGRLQFTTDAREAVAFAEVQFIAVGTPPDEDGAADLRHVLAVARSIGEHMDGYRLVVDKSTVPVGTGDDVQRVIRETLAERGITVPFDVASNPEFLKEGSAVADFTAPDRVVLGVSSDAAQERLRALYAPMNLRPEQLVVMDVRSAELAKYAANAMLATRISFMNEMANLAELLNADIDQVRRVLATDPRIGPHFIQPGCGYGGSCFPKDVRALERMAAQQGYAARLIAEVEGVNRRQKERLFHKLAAHFGGEGQLAGRTIAVWGLAFKPGTDDIREAPSRTLIEALWDVGAQVRAFDPVAMESIRRAYGERSDLVLAGDMYAALEGAHALVICTEWREFRQPDFAQMRARMASATVVDGRNLYAPDASELADWTYLPVGRPQQVAADLRPVRSPVPASAV